MCLRDIIIPALPDVGATFNRVAFSVFGYWVRRVPSRIGPRVRDW